VTGRAVEHAWDALGERMGGTTRNRYLYKRDM
jgi:hypothetical protein